MKNARLNKITSLDSKNAHISIYNCENINITHVKLLAPTDSPNTDGIKMGSSTEISISNSLIATGDDCIAILSGTSHVDISYLTCGPGHGISIGSLGKYKGEKDVQNIKIRDSTLQDTDNGLRIKTWDSNIPLTVSEITYTNILMNNVQNPIIIDQNYCPHFACRDPNQMVCF